MRQIRHSDAKFGWTELREPFIYDEEKVGYISTEAGAVLFETVGSQSFTRVDLYAIADRMGELQTAADFIDIQNGGATDGQDPCES
jgi:hypothetical protein